MSARDLGKSQKKIFRIADILAKIRTEHLLNIGVCILLRVYPVMLINHRTQQCLVLVFIVHSHYMFDINVATLKYILSHSTWRWPPIGAETYSVSAQ
jgi:hypothetical protein